MGIAQGMVLARGASAVPGSPFLGKPGPCVQGRGRGGTLEHRETHPWDCPTWVLETGRTARGRGEQDFHLQAVPPAPSLVLRILEQGYWYPRLLEGS